MTAPFVKTALSLTATVALVAGAPSTAHGYASGSSLTKNCHERITFRALDASPWPDGATAPDTEDGRRLGDQLAVGVPPEHRNLWSVSTIVGVRWPDFEGAEPSDFVALNGVHTETADQREHCLRAAVMDDTPDDPAGSRAAVAACRAYIIEQVELALGPSDTVDLEETEEVEMWLAFVGDQDVHLQRFGYHMGQALHALQDSFSHTVRTDDGRRVRHVLNFAETIDGNLDEDVDGHAHMSALDNCELGTPLVDDRVSQATEASAALLRAVAGGEGGRAGRLDRVDGVLDDWLTFADGGECVLDIDRCNPPELAQTPASGCSAGGRFGGGALALLFGLIGYLASRRRAFAVAGLLVLGSTLFGSTASAQEAEVGSHIDSPPEDIAEEEREADRTLRAADDEELAERERELEEEGAEVVAVDRANEELSVVQERQVEADDGGEAINGGVGFQVSLFGSLDEVGFGAALGLRFPLADRFILGVDAEYDGWFSAEAGRFETGTANAYLTGIIVWATIDRVEIRTNVHAGVSVLLSNLYNNDRGSVGPFIGITPISIAIRATRAIRVTLDPGGVFLEIPRVSPGPPLIRRAHRLMVGLQITP